MAQTTVLTSQTAAGNGDDFDVGTTPVSLVLFTDETDGNPGRAKLIVQQKGPGSVYAPYYKEQGETHFLRRPVYLTNTERAIVIGSPGTYRVIKAATSKKVGAYVEDGAA